LIPEWTQPTLSQEEIRRNGGVPPPPQPILPNKFVVQLYNPDQQVMVEHHPSTWNSVQHWDFSMPTQTFRQPSTSTLDRSQNDPALSEATPQVEFRWKREGKLSKDLLCNLNGRKNSDKGRKHKEPDIPMAFFRNLKEMTLYAPNLARVDMEDPKGFEIVLLLSAVTIKDVYFASMKEAFNINEAGRVRALSAPPNHRSTSDPTTMTTRPLHTAPSNTLPHRSQRPSLSVQTPTNSNIYPDRPPPTDPRTQWEIDAETIRLKKQVEAEEKERKKREAYELKHVRRMVEEEERIARKKQEEIDRETERLRKEYEAEQRRVAKQTGMRPPNLPPRHQVSSSYSTPSTFHGHQLMPSSYSSSSSSSHGHHQAIPSTYGNLAPLPPSGVNGPYLQAPYAGSSTHLGIDHNQRIKPKRSSFFGLRGGGDDSAKIVKKQSAIF
jgi:hypothetical protein